MFKKKTYITILLLGALSLSACSVIPASVSGLLNLDQVKAGVSENAVAPATDTKTAVADSAPEPQNDTLDIVPSEGVAALQGTLEQVYEQVNPSVVNIRVVVKSDGQIRSEFGFPFDEYSGEIPSQEAVGSGFVWDHEGHIVTNNHVVEDADQVTVTFEDGRILPAEVVGTDPDADLAVIKVDTNADFLHPVIMADSSKVKVGQLAIAIGNPFALQGTMTVGIISALDRSLPIDSRSWNGATYTIPEIIQTDAPINPGNSGGVLLNVSGEVVGVPTAIESTTQASAGIGFVIPAEIVRRVVPQLIEYGEFQHPWLGISGSTLTSPVAEEMGLSEDQRGVLVIEVLNGSPADKAGLRGSDKEVTINDSHAVVGGDVIIKIGDEKVEMFDDVASYLVRKGEIGEPLTLVVLRDGKEKSIEVALEKRPGDENSIVEVDRRGIGSRQGSAWLGLKGVTLDQEIAAAMGLDADQEGVLVVQLVDKGPADEAGLQGSFESSEIDAQQMDIGGDVIVSLDGEKVSSMENLVETLTSYAAGDEVTLGIIREGKTMKVGVTLSERPQD